MNYPAASSGVSSGNFYRPKGRGIEPSSAGGGLKKTSLLPEFDSDDTGSFSIGFSIPNQPGEFIDPIEHPEAGRLRLFTQTSKRPPENLAVSNVCVTSMEAMHVKVPVSTGAGSVGHAGGHVPAIDYQ
jgi:hypothetical protein